jgi:TolA-binding protein
MNKYLRFIILLVPVVFLAVSCSGRKVETRLHWAEELKGTRKFDEALQVYKLITNNYPTDKKTATAYLKMGDLYLYTLKDSDNALIAFSKVVDRWPLLDDAREASLRRAEIFMNRDDVRDAIAEYERVYKRFPMHEERFQAKLQIAEGYLDLSDPYQASVELEEMLDGEDLGFFQNDPGRKRFKSWWACYGKECLFDVADFRKSKLSDDLFSKALFNLGESYLFLEEFGKALNYFRILERKFPEVSFLMDARLGMVECLEKLNLMDEAIALQRRLIKLYPDSEVVKKRIEALIKREEKSERPREEEWQIKDDLKVKGKLKKKYGPEVKSRENGDV